MTKSSSYIYNIAPFEVYEFLWHPIKILNITGRKEERIPNRVELGE